MENLIDKNIAKKKKQLLEYYRNRASELVAEVKGIFSESEYKERANATNKGLVEAKHTLLKILEQKANKEKWKPEDLLKGVLIVTYTNYIVMMETRNDVWSYEYMAFARRIGELWEPFVKLCWEYPVNKDVSHCLMMLEKNFQKK